MSFIKLDRRLKEWQWKTDPNMVAMWIHLLLEANYKENNWKGIQLPKGTFPTSTKSLSEKTGLSIQQTKTCLKKLQLTNEITIKSTNKYSLITINKWAEYQCNDEMLTSKITNKIIDNQPSNNNHSNNTIRNIRKKEEKEDKNISYTFAPSSKENDAIARIPLNEVDTYFLVFQEDIDHYKELYPAVDVEQEIRSMVGWCEANPQNRKTKRGVRHFIANWLSKTQNRSRAYSTQAKKGDEIFYDVN